MNRTDPKGSSLKQASRVSSTGSDGASPERITQS